MSNPFLERSKKQSMIGHGLKSEKRVAQSMKARLHPNSGAMVGAKSDASLKEENFRLEMKSTEAVTLRLELAWLTKIATESLPSGQSPAVVISFVDRDGKPRSKKYADWVVLPKEVFLELIGESHANTDGRGARRGADSTT